MAWNKEEKLVFVKLITVLNQTFDKNSVLTKADYEIYSTALSHLDLQTLEFAVNELIRTRIYPGMPRPGEIVAAAKNKAILIAKNIFVTLVFPAVRDSGAVNNVLFSDPLIHCVIVDRWKSWPGFCNALTTDTFSAMEKEFSEKYASLFLKEEAIGVVPALIGYIDAGNIGLPLPVLSGYATSLGENKVLDITMLSYDVYGEDAGAQKTKAHLGQPLVDFVALNNAQGDSDDCL